MARSGAARTSSAVTSPADRTTAVVAQSKSALGPTVARVVSTVMGYRWHEISELVPVNVTVAGASGIPASPGVPEYVVVEGKGAPPTAYLRR